MNKLTRYILAVVATIGLLLSSSIALYFIFNISSIGLLLASNFKDARFWHKLVSAFVLLCYLSISILGLLYALFGDRYRSRRTSINDYGHIEIGAVAIENIALNSAKTSQAGIKSAKARVQSIDSENINLILDVILYSDVEIPKQMHRIQERVKKDIEKYTGISVQKVLINVKKVELIGSLVER